MQIKIDTPRNRALDIVYGSAQNVPGAKMGIIIQRMISHPEIAGVVYSQGIPPCR